MQHRFINRKIRRSSIINFCTYRQFVKFTKRLFSKCDLQELRFLYDRVETEVRSLDYLGVPATNYGPMLAPALMEKSCWKKQEKALSELKLMISRKCSNKELWNIKNILVVLQRRVESAGKRFYKNNQ